MVLMLAPDRVSQKGSTINANLFAGYSESNRQKIAENDSEAPEVWVVGVPEAADSPCQPIDGGVEALFSISERILNCQP